LYHSALRIYHYAISYNVAVVIAGFTSLAFVIAAVVFAAVTILVLRGMEATRRLRDTGEGQANILHTSVVKGSRVGAFGGDANTEEGPDEEDEEDQEGEEAEEAEEAEEGEEDLAEGEANLKTVGPNSCPACGAAVVREVLFSVPEEAFARQEQELRSSLEEGKVPAWVGGELELGSGKEGPTVVVELASCLYCDEGRVRFLPGRGTEPLAEASSRPEMVVGTDAGESLREWLARRSGSAEPAA